MKFLGGCMADQLIGVLGTLGGTLIGIIGAIIINARSNSHSTKLQKLKNEHDIAIKEQERNRAFLEELCELCFQVQKKVLLAVSDIKDLRELTHLDLSEPTNR